MTEFVHEEDSGALRDAGSGMYSSRLVAVALAFVLLVTVNGAAYAYAGAPWAITTLLAGVIALPAWMLTTMRRPVGAPAAFSLYMGTVTALMPFEAEEWYRGMPSHLVRLFPGAFPAGVGITEHAFIAVFPLTLSAFFALGALLYYHDTAFGRFCAWLTFAWGLTASLSVYMYVLTSGRPFHYMGGMITAPLPCLLAVAGMTRLLRREGRNTGMRESAAS